MFDIGASELLVIVVVAILVIGPKDMPRAMRMAGRWIGKVRRVSNHFRTGIDAMIREAELEDMEKQWKAQNAAIMAQTQGAAEAENVEDIATGPPANLLPDTSRLDEPKLDDAQGNGTEPELPLGKSATKD